jgi:tRNA-specific 2-thiouridylase
MELAKKKVFVGMSGGVDSSLSAALLKEQGYDVTGVFIKVWQPDFIECTWKEDRLDAMRVASELDIAFLTLDLEKEYKEEVIDYMIDEYKKGRTPNPDVMCNREVKFGAFWKWAKSQNADYIATGHYSVTEGKNLFISKDENKDQTYFLWKLRNDDLAHVLFPIGHMTKDEVREEAKKRNLYTSSKKDSQGLCFVGTIDIKTLLKNYIDEKEGDVVTESGEVIGHHQGVMFHTLGERHGFTITKKGTDDTPCYVVKKDVEKNLLYVSHIKPHSVGGDVVLLTDVSAVNEDFEIGKVYTARGRYRAPLATVKVKEKKEGNMSIVVEGGDLVTASGQSVVIYDGNRVMGGGVVV